MQVSGAAQLLASAGLQLVGQQPWLALLVIYALTSATDRGHHQQRRGGIDVPHRPGRRRGTGVSPCGRLSRC